MHFMQKGENPHTDEERARMASYGADYAVVLDQGSRGGPSLVPPKDEGGAKVKTMLLDHHLSDDFPEDALVGVASQPSLTLADTP
jgi:hypothetical protein